MSARLLKKSELPPGWDFKVSPGGKVAYVDHEGAERRDPRLDPPTFTRLMHEASMRGVDLHLWEKSLEAGASE
jgi:hypothetical protein